MRNSTLLNLARMPSHGVIPVHLFALINLNCECGQKCLGYFSLLRRASFLLSHETILHNRMSAWEGGWLILQLFLDNLLKNGTGQYPA